MGIEVVSGEVKSQSLNNNFSYLDSKLDQVNGGPLGSLGSVTELNQKYPDGANGFFIIDGHMWFWENGKWVNKGVYQAAGIADKYVTSDKIADNVRLKNFPFISDAHVQENMKNSIENINIYGTSDGDKYVLSVIRKNQGVDNISSLIIHSWVDDGFGDVVAHFTKKNYAPKNNLETIKLESANTSNISALITINWGYLDDNTNIVSQGWDNAGIHNMCYFKNIENLSINAQMLSNEIKMKNYPFSSESAVPNQIKNAFLDIEINNSEQNKKYVISVIRKNHNGQWGINIHEWINGNFSDNVACYWNAKNYTPENNIETLRLTNIYGELIEANVTIDWSKIADKTNLSSQDSTKTLIDSKCINQIYEYSSNVPLSYEPSFDKSTEFTKIGFWENRQVNESNVTFTCFAGSELVLQVVNTANVALEFEIGGMSNVPDFYVQVDFEDWALYKVQNLVSILDGASAEEHIIRIKTNQINFANDVFNGELVGGFNLKSIQIDNQGLIIPINTKSKKGLFIGDSITAGQGSGSAYNYVSVASQLLSFQDMRFAFSGAGLVNGSRPTIPTAQEYSFYSSKNSYGVADFPDFIVINIGTNDLGKTNSYDFKENFISFVKRLQKKYPSTPIILMVPINKSFSVEIIEISVATNTHCINTQFWPTINTVDGVHPDDEGSRLMGELTANELMKIFGPNYFH